MSKEEKNCPLHSNPSCPFVDDIATLKADVAWIKKLLFVGMGALAPVIIQALLDIAGGL